MLNEDKNMDGNNTKISFIPRGSLVREESFLERRRPRSVLGFLAFLCFVSSIGAYAGFSYYNDSLNKVIIEKTHEIEKIQSEFRAAPEVEQAKVFNTRAELARELLNSHTVLSPVLSFLSKYTTESIYYDNFSIKNEGGNAELDLSGEAPTYAALAFQSDVFQKQDKELLEFLVSNVELTSFGTVKFDFKMVFAPDYLLYDKNFGKTESLDSQATTTISFATASIEATDTADTFSAMGASSSSPLSPSAEAASQRGVPPVGAVSAFSATEAKEQSILMSLWSKFKFW